MHARVVFITTLSCYCTCNPFGVTKPCQKEEHKDIVNNCIQSILDCNLIYEERYKYSNYAFNYSGRTGIVLEFLKKNLYILFHELNLHLI